MKKEELLNVLAESFYNKPETIRALMIDFCALKSLLVEKGVITEQECSEVIPEVAKRLDEEVLQKVRDLVEKDNPGISVFLDLLTGVFKKKEEDA